MRAATSGPIEAKRALAKLTLSLRITGVTAEGRHLLEAEMVTVDLVDVLTFGDGDGLEVVGPCAAGVPDGEDNLVRRALLAVGRRARVRLEKHIAPGAGLGGGSADAAAVLRWAGCHDLQLASSIGSDVPFCLRGGRARITGTGEIVEPLPFQSGAFTLLVPPLSVSTAAVYRTWDDLGGPVGEADNDLEPAALVVEPQLAHWRDRLARASGLRPRLAGSGGTWFVEGEFPGEERIVVRAACP